MYSTKTATLLSSQVDFALRRPQTSHKPSNSRFKILAVAAALGICVATTLLITKPFSKADVEENIVLSENIPESESNPPVAQEMQAPSLAAGNVGPIKSEKVIISPIAATNIATTQFYGPPQKFEIIPSGKMTEVTVKSGDTLATIFNNLGISSSTLHTILSQDLAGAELQKIYPGQKLTFVSDNKGLKQIRYPQSVNETFVINNHADGITVDLIARPEKCVKTMPLPILMALFICPPKMPVSMLISLWNWPKFLLMTSTFT